MDSLVNMLLWIQLDRLTTTMNVGIELEVITVITTPAFTDLATSGTRVPPVPPAFTHTQYFLLPWHHIKGSGTVTLKRYPSISLSQSGIGTYPDNYLV